MNTTGTLNRLVKSHDAADGSRDGRTRLLVGTCNHDGFARPPSFDPYSARTERRFGGDGLWSPNSRYSYHLARVRDAARFVSYDSFEADPTTPAGLHKYTYASTSPVRAWDPTGNSLVERLVVAGIILVLAVCLLSPLRNASLSIVDPNQVVPVNRSRLVGVYHSMKLRGPLARTADEVFLYMARLSERNMYPVQADSNVAGPGQVISFDMRQDGIWDLGGHFRELGQGDFRVRVLYYSLAERTFVIRTLGGHPLAGWRLWRVRTMADGDTLIETFSVEHPAPTLSDSFKMLIGGGSGVNLTWKNLLLDVKSFSGGSIVHDSDTQLEGRAMDHSEAIGRVPAVEYDGE